MTDRVRGMIILEGPDGAGKTTLARALCTRYDGLYMHGRYWPKPFPYHAAMLRRAARESQRRLVVVDRHWISESIYGRAFRGAGAHGPLLRLFDRIWRRFGALYIICLPPTAVVIENHKRLKKERKEQYDEVAEVAERYRRLLAGEPDVSPPDADYVDQLTRAGIAERHRRWFHYDYRYFPNVGPDSPIVSALAWKLNVLRGHTWRPGLDYALWNFAGNGYGKVLLVGDRVNDDGLRAVRWPFFADRGSSKYLAQTLNALAVDEDDLAFIDANDPGGLYAAALARRMRVVALGNAARDALKAMGVGASAVIRHPQAARRFTYHDKSYETELDLALGPYVRRL